MWSLLSPRGLSLYPLGLNCREPATHPRRLPREFPSVSYPEEFRFDATPLVVGVRSCCKNSKNKTKPITVQTRSSLIGSSRYGCKFTSRVDWQVLSHFYQEGKYFNTKPWTPVRCPCDTSSGKESLIIFVDSTTLGSARSITLLPLPVFCDTLCLIT